MEGVFENSQRKTGNFLIMIAIKKATEADIRLIHKLGCEAFPQTYEKILSPAQIEYMLDWMYSEKSIAEQMKEGHTYYIGLLDGEPFGYVSVRRESEALFHLEKIYLLKRFQGRKLGRLLFEKAQEHVKSECPSPCRMILNVNRYNAALGFYKRMGMSEVGRGDFTIGNGFFMNDYIMGIDL